MRQLDRDRTDAEFEQDILDLQKKRELLRQAEEQKSALEAMKLQSEIQKLQLDIERRKVMAEQESAEKWLDIKMKKQRFNQEQKIDMFKAFSNGDLQALIAIEDDPGKRADLLKLYEQQLQSRMTPELLLAAAAARGNSSAAEAMAKLSQEKLDAVIRSKEENRELYEQMINMSERMFNKSVESMAKRFSEGGSNISTIIK